MGGRFDDEEKWDKAFAETQGKLVDAAREARKQIAEGKSEPMDFDTWSHGEWPMPP